MLYLRQIMYRHLRSSFWVWKNVGCLGNLKNRDRLLTCKSVPQLSESKIPVPKVVGLVCKGARLRSASSTKNLTNGVCGLRSPHNRNRSWENEQN